MARRAAGPSPPWAVEDDGWVRIATGKARCTGLERWWLAAIAARDKGGGRGERAELEKGSMVTSSDAGVGRDDGSGRTARVG